MIAAKTAKLVLLRALLVWAQLRLGRLLFDGGPAAFTPRNFLTDFVVALMIVLVLRCVDRVAAANSLHREAR